MTFSFFLKFLHFLPMLQKIIRLLACCKKLYVCWRSVIRLRVTYFERFLRLLAKYYVCWLFTFAGEVLYVCWRFTFAGATPLLSAIMVNDLPNVVSKWQNHLVCRDDAVLFYNSLRKLRKL